MITTTTSSAATPCRLQVCTMIGLHLVAQSKHLLVALVVDILDADVASSVLQSDARHELDGLPQTFIALPDIGHLHHEDLALLLPVFFVQ